MARGVGSHQLQQSLHAGEMNRTGDALYVPPAGGRLLYWGATVPTDAAAGYAPGALFFHYDGTADTVLYVNDGSVTSCDFNALATMPTAGVATASKPLVLDASGHLASGAIILDDMTPGTGISTGTGTICEHTVTKVGGVFKTEILIDLTGLNSGGTANDIIGVADTANCHIGQITAAKNGTITAARMTCFETPAGGDDDIDVYSATVATGTEDTAVTALTGQAALLNAGDSSAGSTDVFTALPAADSYLYLSCGTGDTNATYTAGILLIELWGK